MSSLPPTFVQDFHDEKAVGQMEYSLLGETGLRLSRLGFGGGALGSIYG